MKRIHHGGMGNKNEPELLFKKESFQSKSCCQGVKFASFTSLKKSKTGILSA
jgi:hypothetical protein